MDMTGIVILNWNGFEDTIECLDSLFQTSYKEFHVCLIDNASTDGSQHKLAEYIKEKNYSEKITLMLENENHGFAIGSNIGIKWCLNNNCDYIWLLNNDTIVEKDTLKKLMDEIILKEEVMIVSPKIVYDSSPQIIWNCGGKISLLGFRKYYYAGKKIDSCRNNPFSISFVTNCASLFRREYFERFGFLSELFFFGEEDFEMCLRNKQNKIRMECVPSSVLRHKVSRSISKMDSTKSLKKIFVHYLNRYIDMKLFFNNNVLFFLYKMFYTPYIFFLLLKNKYCFKEVMEFVAKLNMQSKLKNNVNHTEFDNIMRYSF